MKRLKVAEGPDLKAILLSLFVVFHLLEWLAGSFSFSVPDDAPFAEDLATWENIRIQSRLDFFFYAALAGVVSLIALYASWKSLFRKFTPAKFTLPAFIAGWIFILQVSGLLQNPQKEIITLSEIFLLISLFTAFERNARISTFFLTAGASFGLAYFLYMLFAYEKGVLLKFETLFAITALVFSVLKLRFAVLSGKTATKAAVVLMLIPVIWIISTEFLLIANARSWMIKSPLILFPFFLTALSAFFFFRDKAFEKYFSKPNYPLLFLMAILLPAFHQIKYQYSCDPFELANPANAMMRSFEMGEMPLFSFFSSHVLSEQFPGWMYYLLHGYEHNLGFVTYNMFAGMTYYLLMFLITKTVLRSGFRAFFLVLLFPFTETLFPPSYAMLILSGMLSMQLFRQFDQKRIYLYLSWSAFLLLWRLDLGIANLMSASLVFAAVWWGKGFHHHSKTVRKSLFVFGFVAVALFLTVWMINGNNLIHNIRRIWLYISAQQAHGLPLLSLQQDAVFYFHYFLLPFAIAGIGVIQLIRIGKGNANAVHVLIAFFAAAYFFNIQRGLVRHSLYEGNDAFITAFGMFILLIWMITEFRTKLFLSLGLVSLLILSFGFPPRTNQKALLSKWDHKITHPEFAFGLNKIDRFSVESAVCMDQISELKLFADEHFDSKASFIDLSNQPMLYYFLQRPVPSYFNQALQNVVHPGLQQDYLEGLKQFDVPFVIWSSLPELWFDQTDGIPNSMRYDQVREFVFKNYYPYRVIGGRSIWIRNDLKTKFGEANSDAVPPVQFDLLNSPLIRAQKRKLSTESFSGTEVHNSDTIPFHAAADPLQLSELHLLCSNKSDQKVSVHFDYFTDSTRQGSFRFIVPTGENTLIIPVGVQARWRFAGCDKILFYLPREIEIRSYNYVANVKSE